MADEPEWKDANPSTENLQGKGRIVIQFILGGIVLLALSIVSLRVRPLGLVVGTAAFLTGIMMLIRRHKINYKTGLIVTVSGFLLLLANPRFGIASALAGYFLIVGAVGLIIFGLLKAIKLAWDVGKYS
jgi:hypothetical protein